jgi:hypothetical protein
MGLMTDHHARPLPPDTFVKCFLAINRRFSATCWEQKRSPGPLFIAAHRGEAPALATQSATRHRSLARVQSPPAAPRNTSAVVTTPSKLNIPIDF